MNIFNDSCMLVSVYVITLKEFKEIQKDTGLSIAIYYSAGSYTPAAA